MFNETQEQIEKISSVAKWFFVVAALFSKALAICVLWNWFAAPAGAAPISYTLALGLGLLYSAFSGLSVKKVVDTEYQAFVHAIFISIYPLILIALGAVVRLFI